jgi:hypothetical protein
MKFETNKFVWDQERRTFYADVSDLNLSVRHKQIVLHNTQTGGERTFDYIGVEVNDDGEILNWRYHFKKDNLGLVIFND